MSFETEYDTAWATLYQKRVVLLDRRSSLEAELSEVKTQIDHLNDILSHLAPLAGIAGGTNLAALGITNAIRWVLEHSESWMSPTEIKDKLEEKGFDFSSLSVPMASIYKTLSRLADADPPEIIREKEEDGKVFYSWKRPEPEITDDQIPF
ncbi:MAG TPA: hypothetical protein VMD55_09195 [Terracidiphilus sp.]|nr:hypothetical protein [Terracidiphilus sp.]